MRKVRTRLKSWVKRLTLLSSSTRLRHRLSPPPRIQHAALLCSEEPQLLQLQLSSSDSPQVDEESTFETPSDGLPPPSFSGDVTVTPTVSGRNWERSRPKRKSSDGP